MKNKKHGNGQDDDEQKFIEWFMTIVTAVTVIAIIIEIAIWLIK